MSICFFDGKYDTQYRCTYEIKESIIEVEVEYDMNAIRAEEIINEQRNSRKNQNNIN